MRLVQNRTAQLSRICTPEQGGSRHLWKGPIGSILGFMDPSVSIKLLSSAVEAGKQPRTVHERMGVVVFQLNFMCSHEKPPVSGGVNMIWL